MRACQQNDSLADGCFKGSDPVWNVTKGGGTNLACLAELAPKGESWKCLMAQYASSFIKTPIYVMNSAVDVAIGETVILLTLSLHRYWNTCHR